MAAPSNSIRYRKMPGHLRLAFGGYSFWAGDDHFLLVRSSRFSEQYKRFFYSDIQGIAIAEAPRWHLSTRAFVIAALWLAVVIATARWPRVRDAIAWSGLIFPVAWFFVSLLGSCRCRIYTAVSNDELPCVYRRWTAEKFLTAVEPLIAARQGAVPADWAAVAEASGTAPPMVKTAPYRDTGAARTFASDLLIGALLLSIGIELAHWPAAAGQWMQFVSSLAIVTGSIAVMVHRHRGLIRPAMQTLAVIALLSMGLLWYGRVLVLAGIAGYQASKSGNVVTTLDYSEPQQMRPYSAGLYAILGIVGLALSLRANPAPRPPVSE